MLPKLDVPIYNIKLISTGQEVRIRPFLVKEQKLFLMAAESEDSKETINTIKQVLKNCILDATEMLIRGSDGIPTGKRSAPTQPPWDDAFTGIKGTPAVVWEDVARISIECDAPWWVVYSEDSDGVCIEPQTAPPDAQNLGISGENYIEALFVFESLE